MKRMLLALIAALAVVFTLALPAGAYTFSDGFSGSTLNSANWCPTRNWYTSCNAVMPVTGAGESDVANPARVSVGSGHLNLHLVHQPYTLNGTTYQYQGAEVTSMGKRTFGPGTFTARINLQCNAAGHIVNWPAFWLIAPDARSEIDILEGLDGNVEWNYHYINSSGGDAQVGRVVPGNFCGWHTFSVAWGSQLTYKYDGNVVGTVTPAQIGVPVTTQAKAITFDLVQCDAGFCNPTLTPSVMKVDWVHVS